MRTSFLFIAVLFSFLGCVSDDGPKQEALKPGDERLFNPLTVDQFSALKVALINVCGALGEKTNNLEDYVGRDRLSVRYQESDCEGKLSKPVNDEVQVRERNGTYQFQNDRGNFPMAEVETINSGVMKEICANLPNLENPFRVSATSTTAVEFSLSNTGACRNDSQYACLQILRGRINAEGSRYRVSENVLINFRTARGGRTGFYTYKNVKTFGSCDDGVFRTKIATFL